jgi:hypothetical protein
VVGLYEAMGEEVELKCGNDDLKDRRAWLVEIIEEINLI